MHLRKVCFMKNGQVLLWSVQKSLVYWIFYYDIYFSFFFFFLILLKLICEFKRISVLVDIISIGILSEIVIFEYNNIFAQK